MTDPRFDPAQVFAVFDMRQVDSAGFDAAVVQAPGSDLRCVFLWGQDCYNCNLFKQAALLHQETLLGLGLTWFEADVYADEPLGRRFSPAWRPHFCALPGRKAARPHYRLARIAPVHGGDPAPAGNPGGKFQPGVLKNPAGSPSYVGTGNFSPISQIYPR